MSPSPHSLSRIGSSPMNAHTILTCPFCGGKAKLVRHHQYAAVVRCQDCDAEGPDVSGDEAEAVAAWNARHGTDLLQAVISFAELEIEGACADVQLGSAMPDVSVWTNVIDAVAKAGGRS